MKQITINSLKELLDTVKKINRENKYWFRGHSKTEYVLTPSAYRKLIVVEDQFNRPVEPREMEPTDTHGDRIYLPDRLYLDAFFEELDKQAIVYDKSMNLVEKYCLAQHYGVPTPMLDWTTDFSVGCFFACDGREKDSECDIYLLAPVKWNEMCGEKSVLSSGDIIKHSTHLPLAMNGAKKDRRMCRQSGNFTVHGIQVKSLGEYVVEDDSDVLIRLTLSGMVANELSEYLAAFGINKDSIYLGEDEKDIIAKSLRSKNEEVFNKKIEEFRKKWISTPVEDRGIAHHLT